MKYVINSVHSIAHRLRIAYIADKEAHFRSQLRRALLQTMAHIILLLLIARENANLRQLGVHKVLQHGIAEATRAARYHESFVLKGRSGLHIFISPCKGR